MTLVSRYTVGFTALSLIVRASRLPASDEFTSPLAPFVRHLSSVLLFAQAKVWLDSQIARLDLAELSHRFFRRVGLSPESMPFQRLIPNNPQRLAGCPRISSSVLGASAMPALCTSILSLFFTSEPLAEKKGALKIPTLIKQSPTGRIIPGSTRNHSAKS